ncbi:MAG TPA: adenylate/guanylate cyclase domain-containing protein [Actinomycetota bacterium]
MRRCPSCGEENGDRARFCQACATPLEDAAASRDERRVVSVLFVDLVGFTSRSEQLDPEDVRAMLSRYYERARAEIERFGGTVEKFIGDAVMAVFGAPVAYGDDPERAVRAALAVRDAIAEMDFADPLLELQTRAGVNTGEAVVELQARPGAGVAMVAGDVVNTASRLQSNAPVDSVVVGEETYAATRTAIGYEPLEPMTVKGKADPVPAWIAIRPLVAAGERTFSEVPIVGRGEELATLRGMWDLVSAERRPTLVTMFGPAGIGKSRLAHELAHRVEASGGLALRGRSAGYGDTGPYSAFAQQIAQLAGVYDSDEPDEAIEKLRARTVELAVSEDPDEVADHLALLSGLPIDGSVADRETLFFSARLFLEAVARARPTLLVFEDLHFADASLLDLIEFLASRVQDVPLMAVATARPELLTERPAWGGGLPASSSLSLGPLGDADAVELTDRLFTQRGLADLADRAGPLAASSDGNPLFIEELTASLAERSTRNPGELPSSIRSIVAARLDALPRPERDAIFDAAVVGKVFWRGALERLRPDGPDLSPILGSLERRDMVRREASSRIKGEQQFAFKHGLIREVAYLTLPREERRRCHRATAEYLEAVTLRAGDADATLAHHWREAGDDGRALTHVLAAADAAGRGWAKERAVRLYTQALEMVPQDSPERKEIVRKRALAAAASYHEIFDMGGGAPPGGSGPGGSD